MQNLQGLVDESSPIYVEMLSRYTKPGRIFDKGTASWARDDAESHAAKAPHGTPTLNSSDMALYDESYGSKAEFAVMCPHTAYWQTTIAGVAGTLVQKYGTDGAFYRHYHLYQQARAVPAARRRACERVRVRVVACVGV